MLRFSQLFRLWRVLVCQAPRPNTGVHPNWQCVQNAASGLAKVFGKASRFPQHCWWEVSTTVYSRQNRKSADVKKNGSCLEPTTACPSSAPSSRAWGRPQTADGRRHQDSGPHSLLLRREDSFMIQDIPRCPNNLAARSVRPSTPPHSPYLPLIWNTADPSQVQFLFFCAFFELTARNLFNF